MNGRRVAIIEDDPVQQDLLLHVVKSAGGVAEVFPAGEKLLKVLPRESFDLLIVDWALPGVQGPDVVRSVRAGSGPALPILFVTSRAMERDVVAGLAAGADDYVTKPVRPIELAARMRALLRRAYPAPAPGPKCEAFGPFTFDHVERRASVDGVAVDLQPREFELAWYFFRNCGRLLSREHLSAAVLNANPSAVSRSLDTHVSRVRTKMGITPARGFRLVSVYGVGYRLEKLEA